ncbi:MAG: thioredoxin family protein [Mariniblastus sp.]
MALTESTMMKLGTTAPEFSLPNVDGKHVSKNEFAGKPLLVMFICNHCPYVKHIAAELARLGNDYADKGVGIVAVQSNNVDEYPDDSPELMKAEVETHGWLFPYLYDETQQVALAYTAACTPDFFLFDSNHELKYRGRLDETRPTRIRSGVYDSTDNEADGKELRAAIDAVLAGDDPSETQLPSLGCNVKWKPGNEPSYF